MNLGDVDRLRRAGLVSRRRYLDAADAVRDPRAWNRRLARALLVLAAGHAIAACAVLLVEHWPDASRLGRVAAIEAILIASGIGALAAGLDRRPGQALLVATMVGAGILFGLIRQAYPTGAPSFTLFALWAGLTLPLALASRSAVGWLVWLGIGSVALALWGVQELVPRGLLTSADLLVLLGLLSGIVLAARELLVGAGFRWLATNWTRRLAALATLAFPLVPAIGQMLGALAIDASFAPIAVVALVTAIALSYRSVIRDGPAVSLAIGTGALFLMSVGYWIVATAIGFSGGGVLLMIALAALAGWLLVVTGAATILLRAVREGSDERPPEWT